MFKCSPGAPRSTGQIIRELRDRKGLTMKQLAESADISRSYLWQIETADHTPGYEIAEAIARELGTTARDIWPRYAADEPESRAATSPERVDESQRDRQGMGMSDFERVVRILLEAKGSASQQATIYAETARPLIDYAIAEEYVDRFAGLLREWKGDEKAECLISAIEAEAAKDFGKAIRAYRRARSLVDDADVVALIDWNLGTVYRERYQYGNAIDHLERALGRLANRRIADQDVARMETSLGWLYYRAGKYETAKRSFERAIKRWEDIENIREVSPQQSINAARRGLGSVHERQGHFDKALEILSEIVTRAREEADSVEMAWVTARLGFLQIRTGDWEEAEEAMRQGMRQSQALVEALENSRSLKILQEIILNNQGLLLLRKGDYAAALQKSDEALRRATELEDRRGKAFCHMFKAFVYVETDERDPALEQALLAERQFREMGILYHLPELLTARARILLRATGGRGALHLAEEALALATSPDANSRHQEATALRAVGEAQAKLGEGSSAEDSLEESVALLREVKEPYDLACSLLALAQVRQDWGAEPESVSPHLEEAEAIAERLGAEGILGQVGQLMCS